MTVESPRPVPLPTGVVVKDGSKTRAKVALSMPAPVSRKPAVRSAWDENHAAKANRNRSKRIERVTRGRAANGTPVGGKNERSIKNYSWSTRCKATPCKRKGVAKRGNPSVSERPEITASRTFGGEVTQP